MAKKPKVSIPAPTTTVEANTLLKRVGEIDRDTQVIEAEYAQAVAKLRAETDARLGPLSLERDLLVKGLSAFAKSKRSELLQGSEKSVKLPAGTFGWRFTPWKVNTGKTKEEKIIEIIQRLAIRKPSLSQFVRLTPSLDKQALLKRRPLIPHVKYTRSEKFFVEPTPSVDDPEVNSNVVRLVVNN